MTLTPASSRTVALADIAVTGGTEGEVLTIESGVPAWAAASGGDAVLSDSTLGADAASFDIQSISQAYTHLRIVAMLRGTTAGAKIVNLRCNNDSGANYSRQSRTTWGTSVAATEGIGVTAAVVGRAPGSDAPANSFGIVIVSLPFYTSTAAIKAMIGHSGGRESTGSLSMTMQDNTACWFAAPAAVTRLTILPDAGNFLAGSRLMLYGVA